MNYPKSFYIVATDEGCFDFFCSSSCVRAILDGAESMAESVTPQQSLQRTGSDGSDQTCLHCSDAIHWWWSDLDLE